MTTSLVHLTSFGLIGAALMFIVCFEDGFANVDAFPWWENAASWCSAFPLLNLLSPF